MATGISGMEVDSGSRGGSRRGSMSSVGSGSQKRRRGDDSEGESAIYSGIRRDLEEYLFNESNKINKLAIKYILGQFAKLENENINLRVSGSKLEGRLMERSSSIETRDKKSFSEVVAAPKIGRKKIVPKPAEKVVLVYPTDENMEDSEATKKVVKTLIAPKEEGWQIQSFRKLRKGGVAIEAGSRQTVEKIKEAARAQPAIKCVDPSRRWPLIQIFDVDSDMSEKEIQKCLYKQNLEEAGITEKEVIEGVKFKFRTGRRGLEICNWVAECSPRIRHELIVRGRVYVDFASCRVVDYIGVTRCFRCQALGHIAKNCTAAAKVCSHCGVSGHIYSECPAKEQAPVCAVCKAAKKPTGHRSATRDCPFYLRALERKVAMTAYTV